MSLRVLAGQPDTRYIQSGIAGTEFYITVLPTLYGGTPSSKKGWTKSGCGYCYNRGVGPELRPSERWRIIDTLFKVANRGIVPLHVRGAVSNFDSTAFSIDPSYTSAFDLAATGSPNDQKEFSVTFTPTADRQYAGTISFTSDASGTKNQVLLFGQRVSTTSVPELPSDVAYVYTVPNPAASFVCFSWLNPQSGNLRIYGVLGNEVYSQAIDLLKSCTVNVNNLDNGLYLYIIGGKSGSFLIHKWFRCSTLILPEQPCNRTMIEIRSSGILPVLWSKKIAQAGCPGYDCCNSALARRQEVWIIRVLLLL
jgi:hypothetical protein